MPIYEYQCTVCGSHFEIRQSVADGPMKKCEKCGGAVEKKWSLSGFQFKGEGWYVTDYAAKKGGEKASDGATAPSGGNDKSAASEIKEKSSGGESTAPAETASKPKGDPPSSPKADKGSGKPK